MIINLNIYFDYTQLSFESIELDWVFSKNVSECKRVFSDVCTIYSMHVLSLEQYYMYVYPPPHLAHVDSRR